MISNYDVRGRVLSYVFMGTVLCSAGAIATPLDDYIATPDPAFTYGPTPANVITTSDGTAYIWYMASGTWRTPAEVDRTLWEHWLTIMVPNTVSHTKAALFVSGGSNRPTPPAGADAAVAQMAVATQSIIAVLGQIPNEKLKFADERDPRYVEHGRNEDEIIAYAWDKYKSTGDPTWLPRLPMTRAVVRAMDVIQAQYPSIDGFLVAGASKRGHTTWTTGIVDPRAEAIVPMVIDDLNMEHSMQHHWDAYGFWAEAVQDYTDMGIMSWLHTPEFRALCDVVDPYEYADRLTQPKYVMASTGDQFFLPDSSQFYFGALPGEKYLRYVPNTDHAVDSNPTAIADFAAYYASFLNGTPRPQFSWTRQPDGALHVRTITPPSKVLLWQATNPNARDFRLHPTPTTTGPLWTSSELTDEGDGITGLYIADVDAPAQGWNAFLVELEYPSGSAYPFHFTTEVSVVPDTYPFRNVGGWGHLETVGSGTDAISLVRLHGSRYEMGYWYGQLLADQIGAMWINTQTLAAGAGATEQDFDNAIAALWRSAYFDTTGWEGELRGVADGCLDGGHPEITFRVLQKMLVLADIAENGCGLYALWGNATATGDLYQMRNLDWVMNAGFQDCPVVALYNPTDGGRRHALIGFAGQLGAAGGGINEDGLAVSEIMGHFCDAETLDGAPFPVLLRDVLYHDITLAQALDRIGNAVRTNQYHYCLADPAAPDPKGRLLFTSHTRFDQYGDVAVTGHPCVSPDPFHTPLDDVIYWKKHNGGGNENLYNAIVARYGSIADTEAIDIAKADGVAGTLLSIVYNNTQRTFWAAFANGLDPAQNQSYVPFSLNPDADGDGISDEEEGPDDSDGDTVPNFLDTDSDDDGMPDEFEHQYHLNPYLDDAGLDPDGDGRDNYQEYLDGTDPHQPTGMPAVGLGGSIGLALVIAASALRQYRRNGGA